LQGAAFEVVEACALLDGLAHEIAEILSEGEQAIRLARHSRRCDDHATASMRVVVKKPKHDVEAIFCLAHFAENPRPVSRKAGYTPGESLPAPQRLEIETGLRASLPELNRLVSDGIAWETFHETPQPQRRAELDRWLSAHFPSSLQVCAAGRQRKVMLLVAAFALAICAIVVVDVFFVGIIPGIVKNLRQDTGVAQGQLTGEKKKGQPK